MDEESKSMQLNYAQDAIDGAELKHIQGSGHDRDDSLKILYLQN